MKPEQKPRRLRRLAVAAAFGAAVPLVLAACSGGGGGGASPGGQEGWVPDRDIEWIVPNSPGGGFDTYSRGLAQYMAEFLPEGIDIVVRNITPTPQGITSLFNAEPDGYTLGILPMPAAIAQEIQDPSIATWKTDEFTVLGSVDENAYVVYVPGQSPFETIEDIIDTPDLNSATVEQGSSSALAGAATIAALDLDATVTYGLEGSAEVATAALRGDADFIVYGTTDLVGFVDSGDLRPILFLGTEDQRPEELEWLADVPSAEEAGYPDLAGTVTELRAIVAPPGLPDDVAEYLRNALAETMASDGFIEWAAENERPLVPRDAEGAGAAMQSQIEAMRVLVPELSE